MRQVLTLIPILQRRKLSPEKWNHFFEVLETGRYWRFESNRPSDLSPRCPCLPSLQTHLSVHSVPWGHTCFSLPRQLSYIQPHLLPPLLPWDTPSLADIALLAKLVIASSFPPDPQQPGASTVSCQYTHVSPGTPWSPEPPVSTGTSFPLTHVSCDPSYLYSLPVSTSASSARLPLCQYLNLSLPISISLCLFSSLPVS